MKKLILVLVLMSVGSLQSAAKSGKAKGQAAAAAKSRILNLTVCSGAVYKTTVCGQVEITVTDDQTMEDVSENAFNEIKEKHKKLGLGSAVSVDFYYPFGEGSSYETGRRIGTKGELIKYLGKDKSVIALVPSYGARTDWY